MRIEEVKILAERFAKSAAKLAAEVTPEQYPYIEIFAGGKTPLGWLLKDNGINGSIIRNFPKENFYLGIEASERKIEDYEIVELNTWQKGYNKGFRMTVYVNEKKDEMFIVEPNYFHSSFKREGIDQIASCDEACKALQHYVDAMEEYVFMSEKGEISIDTTGTPTGSLRDLEYRRFGLRNSKGYLI